MKKTFLKNLKVLIYFDPDEYLKGWLDDFDRLVAEVGFLTVVGAVEEYCCTFIQKDQGERIPPWVAKAIADIKKIGDAVRKDYHRYCIGDGLSRPR